MSTPCTRLPIFSEQTRYGPLLQTALEKFRRTSYFSISSLELVSSHYLGLVRYCDGCYTKAIDGIRHNFQIFPCETCFNNREIFIKIAHGHQGTFLEPWEVRRAPKRLNVEVQLRYNPALAFDSYFESTLLQLGGGSTTIVGLVFAWLAVPALIVSLVGVIYARRQWRLAQESQGDEQAWIILNRLCNELTNGRASVTREDLERASTGSFHTADTHTG